MDQPTYQASVKVMRSYDYCHFEVTLGSGEPMTLEQVNEMRKEAALLADEAVRQYQIAKTKEDKRRSHQWDHERFLERVQRIREKAESDWSVEEAAVMRSHADGEFWKQFQDDDYIYRDDEQAHHFSMLHKFRKSRVRP